jgi:nitroalkane oxidase
MGKERRDKDLTPLERIMRDAMVFPLYDGGNQGVRRRKLHDIMRHPGYDSMLAARGEGLPGDR